MRKARQNHNRIASGFKSLPTLLFASVLFALLFLLPMTAAAAQSITIPVEVAYNGSGLPEETFRIELVDGNGGSTVQEIALTNNVRSGQVSFALAADRGTGSYTLREIPGSTAGMEYSGVTYRLKVSVDESGNAVVTATDSRTGKESKPDKLRFENAFTIPSYAVGDPPVSVQKRISGDKPASAQLFTFVMTPDDPSYPLPEGAADGKKEMTILGEGEVEFGDIVFTAPGVYRYTVTERNDGAAGYTYDDVVYTVVYTVTEGNGGALTSDRQIIKGVDTVNVCVFTNRYTAKNTGGKPVSTPGSTPQTGDTSNLTLYGGMTAVSLAGIFFLLFLAWRDRKKQRDEQAG